MSCMERTAIMEISRMLVISTAHITEGTADALNESVYGYESGIDLCVHEKKDYGFFIHIPEDWKEERGLPPDLQACMELAGGNGCGWLCLDRDAETVSCLPVYEWNGDSRKREKQYTQDEEAVQIYTVCK